MTTQDELIKKLSRTVEDTIRIERVKAMHEERERLSVTRLSCKGSGIEDTLYDILASEIGYDYRWRKTTIDRLMGAVHNALMVQAEKQQHATGNNDVEFIGDMLTAIGLKVEATP